VESHPDDFAAIGWLNANVAGAPVVLEALTKLTTHPDLLLCDGHGYAHPRRFGLACHLGLWSDIASIGVAKRRLIGHHAAVEDARGARQALWHEGEIVGTALRTRSGTKPIYVSIGHRVSLETAINLVLQCCPKFRQPEPTRWAHRLASRPPD
jgi:deoxyribonuclease V